MLLNNNKTENKLEISGESIKFGSRRRTARAVPLLHNSTECHQMQWSCTCFADSPKWPKLENYFGANVDAPSLARPLIVIFHVAPSSRPRRQLNRRTWTQFYANQIRWFSMLPTESWLAWFLSQMLLVGIAVTHFRPRRGNRLRYNCISDRRTRFFLHQIVRSSAPTFSFFHFFIRNTHHHFFWCSRCFQPRCCSYPWLIQCTSFQSLQLSHM